MLTVTKICILIVLVGSGFDLTTSIFNLYINHYFELNPLFYQIGPTTFMVLYIVFTLGIIIFMKIYDKYYGSTHPHFTILTMVTFSLYGVFHFLLGIHNLLIFYGGITH